jgi:hypothetical protein
VAAGIAFFALLGLFLWGAAAYISRNSNEVSLAPTTVDIGRTKTYARIIAEDGPLILPDLLRSSGQRTIVLDHTGTDPQQGWHIYMAYPADRSVDCKVELIKGTRQFTDCEGRTLEIEQLALPEQGVAPIISADGDLSLDLLPASAETATTITT